MQRQSIKQGEQLLEQSLDLQRSATEAFMRNGLAAQRSAQEQGAQFAREFANSQLELFETSIDENEVLSGLEEQFEMFNESQNEAWDDFVSAYLKAIGQMSEQQKELVDHMTETFIDAQQDIERRTIAGVEDAEEAVETVQQQTEETVERVGESAEAAERQFEAQAESVSESLQALSGIGATYAERLVEHGIDSVEALAEANVEAIAEAADVSTTQAEEWIEAAESSA